VEIITLRPLTPKNWVECTKLSVREDQKNFVASNVFSIAEARIFPECVPLAIYADENMVGFVMYALSSEDNRYWIIRYMIDHNYQGKGYGKAALQVVIDEMRRLPGCDRIYLSYEPENRVAEELYNSFGFQPNGEFLEGEKVSCLDFASRTG
jgi:diamine N-acetyltransferase